MRASPPPPKCPLCDAEFVLLVDHNQSEFREVDILLNQCLRPDDQVRCTRFHFRERLPSLRIGQTAGQQSPFDAALGQEGVDRAPVLRRQQFGRSHDECLMSIRDRDQHRVDRDCGFSGSDVCLQQPVHRLIAGDVLADFRDGLVLSGGELKRKQPACSRVNLGVDRQRWCRGTAFPCSASQGQPDLKLQQVLED